jgi:histone acetyltransferase (RNA polymerase elongator complex component)
LGTISRKFKTLKLKFVLGFGTLLMEEAERIAREEHGAHKLAVISGEKFFQLKQKQKFGFLLFIS